MLNIFKFINEFIQPIQIIISIIILFFSGYASFSLRKQNKQLREIAKTAPKIENFPDRVKFYEGKQTSNPVALAIALTPQTLSIKKDVETFLNSVDWGKGIRIEEITMKGINNPEDLERFVNLIREKRHLFDLQGVTEIHLFIQGPIICGILIGAIFDNWKPVKLYHKPTPSIPNIYQYWCPLVK
jgi:hypothetical protein